MMNTININALRITACLILCVFFLPASSGVCGRLRTFELPGEEELFEQRRSKEPIVQQRVREEESVSPSVYDRFKEKVKGLPPAEIPKVIAFYEQKLREARQAGDTFLTKHYTKLLDILRKFREGGG